VLERGWRAVLTAREPAKISELAARYGDRALALRLDLTEAATMQAVVSEAEARVGCIDVLVNMPVTAIWQRSKKVRMPAFGRNARQMSAVLRH
jgi:NADP-dependent 3-hydroxy acid dehydrogenase YdfG